MLVMLSAAVPPLLRVIACAALVVPTVCEAKVRLVGLRAAEGPTAVPVPVRLAVCGLPAALSVKVVVPVRVPAAVGVKVKLMGQFAPAASEGAAVLVCAKDALAAML